MARFRGTVKGSQGESSRLGHATSGLVTRASGWNGHVGARLSYRNGIDWAYVYLETNNGSHCLYDGPLNEYRDPRGVIIPLDVDVK